MGGGGKGGHGISVAYAGARLPYKPGARPRTFGEALCGFVVHLVDDELHAHLRVDGVRSIIIIL